MKVNDIFTIRLKIVLIVLVTSLITVCIASGCYLKQTLLEEEQTVAGEVEAGLSSQTGLTVNKKYIGDIPIIEYYNEATGMTDKPIVIIEYGFTGKKEEMKDIAAEYADIGCLVVTPDLYLHGERMEEADCSILEIPVRSSEEIEEILDYYADSTLVDMDRIGMLGFSLGGMTIYHYLANGTYPVKAVGIICSTPDWQELQNNTIIYQAYSDGELTAIPNEKHEEISKYAVENSPYNKLLQKTDIHYGLICGAQDEVLSCVGTENFYLEYVSKGGTAEYQKYDELGHELRVEDLWNIYYFFTSNL